MTFQLCERTLDDNGRFHPQFDTNRVLTLEADHVLLATGQGTDLAILDGSGVENNHGYIVADSKTLMTGVPGVFAGGDAEHGPRNAVEAIRSGKIAAAAIDAWLWDVPLDPAVGRPVRRAEVVPLQISARDRTHLPRAVMPERSVEEVLGEGNYVEIEEGLSATMARDEARRCLRCDLCRDAGRRRLRHRHRDRVGEYGWAPPGEERLVLGHESLGRVLEAPAGGDRWPKATWWSASCGAPTRFRATAAACSSGTSAATASTPSGASRQLHGYCSERYRITADFAVKVDPDLRSARACSSSRRASWPRRGSRWIWSGGRLHWEPETVLVTGRRPHRAAGGA